MSVETLQVLDTMIRNYFILGGLCYVCLPACRGVVSGVVAGLIVELGNILRK